MPTPRTTIPLALALALVPALLACGDGSTTDPDPPDIAPEPPNQAGFQLVGHATIEGRRTTDLWLRGDHAYTGTLAGPTLPGNRLYVWDVGDPTAPTLVDSVSLDATQTNDVKVSADGSLAVVTHEGSTDGLNGITLLDLADPAHPSVIGRYTTGLERGVHNVWIEDGFVYVAQDGPPGEGRLRILDVGDPAAPVEVAQVTDPGSFVHDVFVRDGLAFVSFWDAGLVILDVGHGIAGGTPADPREVSRIPLDGQTHNAWYWSAGGYVFVGEEDFGSGTSRAPGVLHVVDVSDLRAPVEAATFETENNVTPPHNFWMDEARQILYAAWYEEGVVALDVSGELEGRLEDQGRLLETALPFGAGPCGGGGTCAWAPQLHEGLLFVSDIGNGLVVLRPPF